MSSFRLTVLKIDRSTVLPLHYEYDETISLYRTLGYVRLSPVMLQEFTYRGQDTLAVRDDFLTEVLVGLTIPQERARQIVRDAEHSGAAQDAPVTAAGEPHAPLRQAARNENWELARMADKEDFWRLTNIGDQRLFPVSAMFSMPRDGRTWTDRVALDITVPILHSGGSTQVHIVGSDYVTNVVVRWRGRRSRFSRLREWAVRF
jgi:hypothetical protein